MEKQYHSLKYACYTANISLALVATLSPLLFLTFRSLYGISFSMLGALVLINFCTQLLVDLVFSFYSHKFNISKTVKITPWLTLFGLLIYALFPLFFPHAVYIGLVLGTIVFAASGGLAEVLISPVIAAIPAENPDREMSKLHSVYAWAVVAIVLLSSLFLSLFGTKNWQWLVLLWTLVPLFSAIMFLKASTPQVKAPEKASNVFSLLRCKDFLVFFFCIFLGGASECTMSQWSSSYLEQALHIPKIWGDVFGVALFAVMLGLGRSLYAKYGGNLFRVLILGSAGAAVCYLVAALSSNPLVGLLACALTGFCVTMLWPGSLLVAAERFPAGGVAVFALMAAGGDLGGAVGPQLVGAITDFSIQNASVISMATQWNLSADQLGMKIGLLSATVFPIFATILFAVASKQKHK